MTISSLENNRTADPIEIARYQIESDSYDIKELFILIFKQQYSGEDCPDILSRLISKVRVNKRLKRHLTAHRISKDSSGIYSYYEYNPEVFSLYKKQKEDLGSTFSPEELVQIASEGLSRHFTNQMVNYNRIAEVNFDNL